jgi:hypothetical protein
MVLVLLLLAAGCSSVSEPYAATCTVEREIVDGAENAKVGDYVANMGRGTLVHLDAIDESAGDGVVVAGAGADRAFAGNRKDARILSIGGDLLELGVLDGETATYLANSHLCGT